MTNGFPDAPLYRAICRYANNDYIRLHMPAHAGGSVCGSWLTSAELDVTELAETDSLFHASGPILEAERLAARCFNVKECLMSTGGSTLCIQAMLTCVGIGKKIICGRNAHSSLINTMALLDQTPIWASGDNSAGFPLFGRVTPGETERLIKDNPDAAAVYITSPDYFGVISDIAGISEVCHRHGIPLLVDSAHGAHLAHVGDDLFAVHAGADMAAVSAHKTLPALTGAAWLCVNNEKYIGACRSHMKMFATTSPSYLIMISLDVCRAWLEKDGRAELSQLCRYVKSVKEAAVKHGYTVPLGLCDPARIALGTLNLGVRGYDLQTELIRSGIQIEYADDAYIVMIPSVAHTKDDFDKLIKVLCSVSRGDFCYSHADMYDTASVISLREAVFSDKEEISVADSVGRICGEEVSLCPPCIPVVIPGELITKDIAKHVINAGIFTVKVLK